jgi:hypothetical protein
MTAAKPPTVIFSIKWFLGVPKEISALIESTEACADRLGFEGDNPVPIFFKLKSSVVTLRHGIYRDVGYASYDSAQC